MNITLWLIFAITSLIFVRLSSNYWLRSITLTYRNTWIRFNSASALGSNVEIVNVFPTVSYSCNATLQFLMSLYYACCFTAESAERINAPRSHDVWCWTVGHLISKLPFLSHMQRWQGQFILMNSKFGWIVRFIPGNWLIQKERFVVMNSNSWSQIHSESVFPILSSLICSVGKSDSY